ncbi:aldo/keto reductase [Oscillospiraceae bacterium OttesenSCG-928-F05]|nr:aldo/keto reductase [Oscillospiraceae bacterium OttesenSCG-928-F05]
MEYKHIKGIDKPISQIVLGTIMLTPEKQEYSDMILDTALELGVTCFDTAWGYGGGACERAIGSWFERRGTRDKVVLVTKCAHPTKDRMHSMPYDILSEYHDSEARLGKGMVDIYMLHRDDQSLPVGPTVETMNRLKEQGKINQYGGSNWTARRIEEANEYAYKYGLYPMAISSPNYGLGEQIGEMWGHGSVSLSQKGMEEDKAWYAKTQLAIFAYSSLGRGWFSGKFNRETFAEYKPNLEIFCTRVYEHEGNFKRLDRCFELAAEKGVKVPQIALAYVLNNREMNLFALVGAHNREEIEDAVETAGLKLTEKEMAWLDLRADSRN